MKIAIIFTLYFYMVNSLQPFINSDLDYATSPLDFSNLISAECRIVFRFLQLLKSKNNLENELSLVEGYVMDFEDTLLLDLDLNLEDFQNLFSRSIINIIGVGNDAAKHPFKIYKSIRRLVTKFPGVYSVLQEIGNYDILEEIQEIKKSQPFPKDKDLQTAIFNVLRINQLFKIPFHQFLRGELDGIQTKCGLSTQHFVELGRAAIDSKLYAQAVDAFAVALWSHLNASEESGVNGKGKFHRNEIWNLLNDAIKQHDDKLQGEIEHEDIQTDSGLSLFDHLLYNISHPNFKQRIPVKFETIIPQANYSSDDFRVEVIRNAYAFERLCQGRSNKTPQELTSLRCYHSSKSHSFFILQPLRIEVLNEDPLILQYHDVLNENEIKKMKNEVQGEMRTSRTIRALDEKDTVEQGAISKHRTSSNAWIEDYGHSDFMPILQKIGRILGVNTKRSTGSENMQIAAYSPGGHYVPHTDAIFEEEMLDKLHPTEFLRGDRILTFMIYLADVEKGGGTVFPSLETAVLPKKGSAVMWYNKYPDGSIDRRTLHGGCSVVYGVKWIANKWIRSDDQMFLRKCPTSRKPFWDSSLHI